MSDMQTAADLQRAFGLLQSGQVMAAGQLAMTVAARAPRMADAHHLLALCHKAAGHGAETDQAFRRALDCAPQNLQIRTNFAVWLSQSGRPGDALAEYERLAAANPAQPGVQFGLGLAALKAGHPARAVAALEAASRQDANNSAVWQALGSAQRAAQNLDAAAAAFERAVALAPGNGAAWVNLGVVRRLMGRPKDALPCFDAAERAGFTGPELMDARASVYLDLGRTADCVALYRRLNAGFPYYAPGHAALARILWEQGGEADPATGLKAAVSAQPDNMALQGALVRYLNDRQAYGDALALIRRLRTRADSPALMAAEASALVGLGEGSAAEPLFEQVVQHVPADPEIRIAFMRQLLKSGQVDRALPHAEAALAATPGHQMAWAYQGTLWRLMGDTREDWLHDYDRLVAGVEIDVPTGFTDMASFIVALKAALMPLHTATEAPLDQSLRQGTQTSGFLFGRDETPIRLAREAFSRAIAAHCQGLPKVADHPFLGRLRDGVRYTGAWSVRLRTSGFHVNHVHNEGWISSAFYVALPSVVASDAAGHAGWIQFGQPPADLGLDLVPRRLIRPEVGKLALFPSYTWHGTVPYDEAEARMTIAFDAVPA